MLIQSWCFSYQIFIIPKLFSQSSWPSFSLHETKPRETKGTPPTTCCKKTTCLQEDSFQLLRSQAVILMIRRLFWRAMSPKTGGNERQRSNGDLKRNDFKRKKWAKNDGCTKKQLDGLGVKKGILKKRLHETTVYLRCINGWCLFMGFN